MIKLFGKKEIKPENTDIKKSNKGTLENDLKETLITDILYDDFKDVFPEAIDWYFQKKTKDEIDYHLNG